MHIAYILTENIKRVNRIRFAVTNEICRVKINAEISRADIFNCAAQRYGRLLSGFKKEDCENLEKALDNAAEAARLIVAGKIDMAMNKYSS